MIFSSDEIAMFCENYHRDLQVADALRKQDIFAVLHMTAERGHTEIVRMLLDAGADIHAANKLGKTALSWARFATQAMTVRLLLDRGAVTA